MYEYMMANAKDVLPEDNVIAVEKVKQEEYAFLMESSSIEYILRNAYTYCFFIVIITFISECLFFIKIHNGTRMQCNSSRRTS